MRELWIPAFAGMTEYLMWIPAFAGMTEYLNADFRLCGNNAYALSQTFFHHNLLAPEAICSSDAGKRYREESEL